MPFFAIFVKNNDLSLSNLLRFQIYLFFISFYSNYEVPWYRKCQIIDVMSSLCFIYKHISYKHFFLEKSIPVVYRDFLQYHTACFDCIASRNL